MCSWSEVDDYWIYKFDDNGSSLENCIYLFILLYFIYLFLSSTDSPDNGSV